MAYCLSGLVCHGDWQALWALFAQRITDDAQNKNNRCDLANDLTQQFLILLDHFGAALNDAVHTELPATRPQCFVNEVSEFREIERRLRTAGNHPKSVWQLFGNGVVGSQAFLGIPVLQRLRNDDELKCCSQVWPFETGWHCPAGQRPLVLHAEIWPGAIGVTRGLHVVKDAAQVLSYVYWAARLDVVGHLVARFNPHVGVPVPRLQNCEGSDSRSVVHGRGSCAEPGAAADGGRDASFSEFTVSQSGRRC